MRRRLARALVTLSVLLAILAGGGALAERRIEPQDPTRYRLPGLSLAADSSKATTASPGPGCTYAGIWNGGYFTGGGVTIWGDQHHGGFNDIDWVLDVAFGLPDGDYEIVLVNRSTQNVTRAKPGSRTYPISADLAIGFDVYLCQKPRPFVLQPIVQLGSLDPLILRVTAPADSSWTGNIVLANPPGVSEFAPHSYPIAIEQGFTGQVVIQTGTSFSHVPVVLPHFDGGPNQPATAVLETLLVTPYPNNRTGFVISVIPSQTVWRPTFRLNISGGGTYDFTGARIFRAYDAELVTLILPNDRVPVGTDALDANVTLVGGSPPGQAPAEAHVFALSPTLTFNRGGEADGLRIETTLMNPTDNPVTLTNDSIGVMLADCGTGTPFASIRTTLNGTIAPRANRVFAVEYDDVVVHLGPPRELKPLPDAPPGTPVSPLELFDWMEEVCAAFEGYPALTQ